MKYFLSFIVFVFSSALMAQQADVVDFKTAKVGITGGLNKGEIEGEVIYTFDVLAEADSIFVDAKNIQFDKVFVEGKDFKLNKTNSGYWIVSDFKPSIDNKLLIVYRAKPKKAIYFLNKNKDQQIWTQGQGKYTSNWLPSFDDMNEKIEFDLSIVFDETYEVIANGALIQKDSLDGLIRWHYDMQKPMSSYLVALAIGKYNKKTEYSKSGIPLEMYYYPEDSLKFEPTYRYTKRMFDFLEEEIGVAYPWQNYKQVPVHDFLYAGMENTSLTIFADTFVTDSIGFVDRNYVNVNAHELAHQWFGDLVTETSGTHHWLHEGFATYYALLAEKEVFGEDYYYWKLYESAQQLLAQDKAGGSTSLLDPKSSSLTFYQKGAWVLHMLRARVGDAAFKAAVKKYLQKHQFKNVETDDFISEVELVSGDDLSEFVKTWLEGTNLSILENMSVYLKHLKAYKEAGIKNLSCPVGEDLVKFQKNQNQIKIQKFSENIGTLTKVELFNDLLKDSLVNKTELYAKTIQSKDLKVRQSVAQNLSEIPLDLKVDYETLLKDKSYATIEAALYNLWTNFPEDRTIYLEQTKEVVGFSDKNVRLLWLTLHLVTPDYEPDAKRAVFNELMSYTSSDYGFEIRERAFTYLDGIKACNDTCKEHLKEATKHHNWRLQKFAKNMLNKNQ